MKHLLVKDLTHKRLEVAFKQWLYTLGYSNQTIVSAPVHIRELFHYLEKQGCLIIDELPMSIFKSYINHLQTRKNQRTAGGISLAHINKHIDAINKLFKYLKHVGLITKTIKLDYFEKQTHIPTVLSTLEIKAIYNATTNSLIGIRDRAMLGIYYSCGLRRSEGVNLNTEDIDFSNKLLLVKKTKNNQERFVPITIKTLQDIEYYLSYGRPLLLGEEQTDAFFISERGTRIQGQSLLSRLHALSKQTVSINKQIGLHTLRHSIATHLLQAGIPFKDISLFLGHKSLESTQIYTHIINESAC